MACAPITRNLNPEPITRTRNLYPYPPRIPGEALFMRVLRGAVGKNSAREFHEFRPETMARPGYTTVRTPPRGRSPSGFSKDSASGNGGSVTSALAPCREHSWKSAASRGRHSGKNAPSATSRTTSRCTSSVRHAPVTGTGRGRHGDNTVTRRARGATPFFGVPQGDTAVPSVQRLFSVWPKFSRRGISVQKSSICQRGESR